MSTLAQHTKMVDESIKEENQLYYITNGKYVGNNMMFWRPNGSGYTCHLNEAGKYTSHEARLICSDNNRNERAYKVEEIDAIATTQVDMQRLNRIKTPIVA